MAENNGLYSIQGSTLTDIADAIRERSGDTQRYAPTEMAAAVLAIKGGGIEELPDNLAYLGETIEDGEFIGYGSSVTVDKTGADFGEINPILQALYPIGSIYMSVTYFDPATVFGGVWEQIQDTFLLAAGTSYAAGATGGEATHKLTVDEMPNHYHRGLHWAGADGKTITLNGGGSASHLANPTWNGGLDDGSPIFTGSTGGGAAHNNMPPYLAVYMWQRIA
jgi:hypothetical protein